MIGAEFNEGDCHQASIGTGTKARDSSRDGVRARDLTGGLATVAPQHGPDTEATQ